MDISISKNTLDVFEDVVDDIVLKCLQEVHEKFLSDLDFSELEKIRKQIKKKKFILKKTGEQES
jgi:hypothetical protein